MVEVVIAVILVSVMTAVAQMSVTSMVELKHNSTMASRPP